jgi:hypothetical protein
MIAYRIYPVDEAGHIQGPPIVIECEDDAAAVLEARERIDGVAAEIWDGGRRVAVIPSAQ